MKTLDIVGLELEINFAGESNGGLGSKLQLTREWS